GGAAPGPGCSSQVRDGATCGWGLASVLTAWLPPAPAQLTVTPIPPNPLEGWDVTLSVSGAPGGLLLYNWYRGASLSLTQMILSYINATEIQTPGAAHSGREAVHPNGSLLIQRVTLNDSGSYLLQSINPQFQTEIAFGFLRVYGKSLGKRPEFTSARSGAELNSTLTLWCVTESCPEPQYEWTLNGTSRGRPQDSLLIGAMSWEHQGAYTCIAKNNKTQLSASATVFLTVTGGCWGLRLKEGIPESATEFKDVNNSTVTGCQSDQGLEPRMHRR
uniref:CEA cell adhesion molecule 16, tectorial membrane component n=1 Tax=Ornithorhynchus anatinus TaxID=9258 RepID=A0A6I8NSH0_ORNAN